MFVFPGRSVALPISFALTCLPAAMPAQCSDVWLPGEGVPGVRGVVRAIHDWDPDGAGPLSPLVVVAGQFGFAGSLATPNIAAWDPVTGLWSDLGGGVHGGPLEGVEALVTLANGDLVVVGTFVEAGGVTVHNIARWDGANWSALGTGTDNRIRSAAVMPNGDLVVAGDFHVAGGVGAAGTARWDGLAWSAMGGTGVQAVIAAPNGELFGLAGNAPRRWSGSAWDPLGSGVTWLSANSRMAVLPNNDLVVQGLAITGGGSQSLMRWDGAAWSAMTPAGPTSFTLPLAVAANGDLFAGTGTTIRRWDGALWTTVAMLPDLQTFSVRSSGELVATSKPGVQNVTRCAQWNGSAWVSFGAGADGPVFKLLPMPDGSLVASGLFQSIDGIAANRIARWDGANWSPLGDGFVESTANVLDTAVLPNGDVVAVGIFSQAGGVAADRVARWNGSAWSPIGPPGPQGSTTSVTSVVALPNGDIVVGGRFSAIGGVPAANLARWDGTSWSSFGGGTDAIVNSLVLLPDGDLVASGGFTDTGGVAVEYVARWNGTTWLPVGSSAASILVLLGTTAGDLVGVRNVGAPLTEVVRWDGSTWTTLGGVFDNRVVALEELPNGDLVAAGLFLGVGGVAAQRIARWDGSAWSALGAGVEHAYVADLSMDRRRGELVVAGDFVVAGGQTSGFLARLGTDCQPIAAVYGNGCIGSGGPGALTASTLPWVDATFRSRATGLPSAAIAVTLVGFTSIPQGTLPLTSVFAQALPGCDLLVAPDILGVVAVAAGVAEYQVFLPSTPPLVGTTFYHQMIPIEVDAGGAFVAITATNALALTAGSF